MKYSVIIPIKNEGYDILKCINSLLETNYYKYNAEILLIDDSNSKNKEILKSYLKNKTVKNLQYFENLNLGLSGSCNFAANKCKGEYLVFINADNILPFNFFSNLDLDLSDNKYDTISIQNLVKNTDCIYGAYLDTLNRKKYFDNSYFNKLSTKNFISYTEGFTVSKRKFISSGGFLDQKNNSIIAGEDLILGFNLMDSDAKGKISYATTLQHLVPNNFKEFFYHRFIRGYGVPQVSFYYFRKTKFFLFTKTVFRVTFKSLKLLLLIPLLIETIKYSRYNKKKNFFFKFLILSFLDNFILIFSEVCSLLKIIFTVDSQKIDLQSIYIKSKSCKMIYVTAAEDTKYSPIKNACIIKFNDSLKILAAKKKIRNYSNIFSYNQNIQIYKILFKFGYIYDYENFSSRLINLIKQNDVNYVLINKCIFINYKTLKIIKKISPRLKIIFWGEDNMFTRQNSPKNFIKSLDLFDAYYSIDRGDIENKKITQRVNNCFLTNPTVNKNSILKKILNTSLDLSEINFIGYYDKKRIEYLSYLGNSGIKIKIYGTGWDLCKNKNYRNLSFYDAIYGLDYHKLINNSLVVINFLRDFTKDIINIKSIEIPAYGGLLLSEYTQYQAKLLKNNENVFYFSSKAELLKKINYILDNKDKLDLIRSNALKVINGGRFATEDILEDILLKL